eukprot:Hpha_TRINITY_DN15872_c1_g1::TRINITY_DN15872_c1_g1_i1::g.187853::m.187853
MVLLRTRGISIGLFPSPPHVTPPLNRDWVVGGNIKGGAEYPTRLVPCVGVWGCAEREGTPETRTCQLSRRTFKKSKKTKGVRRGGIQGGGGGGAGHKGQREGHRSGWGGWEAQRRGVGGVGWVVWVERDKGVR